MISSEKITGLLIDWSNGDGRAFDELLPLVESELRRLAKRYMRRMEPGVTLQTTALINEAYLRLVDQNRVKWQNRAHFYGIAANMMRRILLNHIRDRKRIKRGGGAQRVALSDSAIVSREKSAELLALDEALTRLAAFDERKARVVELKFFGGLNVDETAEIIGVSRITVIRDWKMAKAWLAREILNEQ
jgi:RNA polymerase sigma-70 factor (ECF subfamily)